jgi:hypothetical protein
MLFMSANRVRKEEERTWESGNLNISTASIRNDKIWEFLVWKIFQHENDDWLDAIGTCFWHFSTPLVILSSIHLPQPCPWASQHLKAWNYGHHTFPTFVLPTKRRPPGPWGTSDFSSHEIIEALFKEKSKDRPRYKENFVGTTHLLACKKTCCTQIVDMMLERNDEQYCTQREKSS